MEKKLKFRFMILILFLGCLICIYPSTGLTIPYIVIDPVDNHTIGDMIKVTGTTNLPVNTTLVVQAGPRVFTNYEPNYFFKTVQVSRGNDVNIWSVLMNTSTFSADDYNLTIDRVEGSSMMNSTRFTMTHKNINHQTTADTSFATSPTTATIIKNQTGIPEPVIPTTARPAPLPGTIPVIALCCAIVIIFTRKL